MNPYEKILDRVDILDAVKAFESFKVDKMGAIYFGTCPKGHATRGGLGFIIDPEKNIFLCFDCGLGGNVVDLVMHVQKLDFRDSLFWIAEHLYPEILVTLQTASVQEPPPKPKGYYQHAFLYELLFKRGKKLLYESTDGRNIASRFMAQRNYKQDILRNTDWIYFPKDGDIRSFLIKEFPEAQVWVFGTPKKTFEDKLPLQGKLGDKFRLAFPYRDRHGLITGFVKRSVLGTVRDKWDMTRNIIRDDPFYLHRCPGKDSVVVLDRYSETMYLSALGFNNECLIAVGRNGIESNHIEALKSFGIQRVTLFFTNQETSEKNETLHERVEASLRRVQNAGMKALVVELAALSPYDTPELFILGDRIKELAPKGLGAFIKTFRENLVSANIWHAIQASKKWLSAPPGKQHEILCDIIEQRNNMTDILEQEEFDRTIKQHLKLTDTAYNKAIDHCLREKELKNLHKEFRQILIQGLREESNLAAMKSTQEKIMACIQKFENAEMGGNRRLSEVIQEKFHVAMKPDTLAYQWQDIHLSLFPQLKDITKGLRPGLYVVFYKTGSGMTSFLLNMFLDALLSNCDISGRFITLDETIQNLIDRIIACQTGIPLSQVYEESVEDLMKLKEKAFQVLIGLTSQNRLIINDSLELANFSRLVQILDTSQKETILTIIDGLHLIGRHEDNQRANTLSWMDIGCRLKSVALDRQRPIWITYQLPESFDISLFHEGTFPNELNEVSDLIRCSWFSAHLSSDSDRATPSQMNLSFQVLKNKISFIQDTIRYALLPQEGHRLIEIEADEN